MLSRADKIFIALIGAGLMSIYVGTVSMYLWLGLLLVRLFMLNRIELGLFSLMFGSGLCGRMFVSDVLVVVITVVFITLGYVLLRKEILKTIAHHKASFLIFGVLIFYLVVMYLLGPMNSYATGKISRLVVRGITWMLLFQIYVQYKDVNNNHFAIMYGLLSIFYLSQAYVIYGVHPSGLFDVSFFRDIAEEVGRNDSNTMIVNTHTMGYLSVGTLVFFASTKKFNIKSAWNLLYVAILGLLVLISGARQAMIIFVGIMAFRIAVGNGNIVKKALEALLCVCVLAVIAVNSGSSALEKSMEGNNAGEVLHRDLNTPFVVMQVDPVFGVGFGGYQEHGNKSYPHNMFFEIFSEFGIIGSSLFVLILVLSFLIGDIRVMYVTANGSFLILFLVIYFLKAMVSGDLSVSIVIFGVLLSFIKQHKLQLNK